MTSTLTKINREEIVNVGNFGVELELINVDKQMLIAALALKGITAIDYGYGHTVTNEWKIVSDSSIQGDGAIELVSPILNGMAGLKRLRDVCQALSFINATTNKTCGCHIHHEARYLTETQKTNLMRFYARLEKTIDAFMPISRKRDNNRYCLSMVSAYEQLTYTSLNGLGRYYKLNYASLARYGTLEFRQHSGTIDFDKLYHWIIFTANFVVNCKDKTSRDSMNYIERAWTKKHLKLSDRTWEFFKSRMKRLDDINIEERGGTVTNRYSRYAS